MKKKDRELIDKGLDILYLYVKGKTIGRISGGFIAGGISILGFNNLAPYIALSIRPELSKEIAIENNIFTIIGILMIIIGALIPPLVKIFNHYRQLYIEDLEKIDSVYSICDYDTFIYQMARISNNTSIFDYEIDKIEELSFMILDSNFSFNNREANENIKKFGNELSNFNSEMSYRVSPSETNPNLYTAPINLPTYNEIVIDTRTDCNRLIATYNQVKTQFDSLTKKSIMRFFR